MPTFGPDYACPVPVRATLDSSAEAICLSLRSRTLRTFKFGNA